jgi:hypothetical protein
VLSKCANPGCREEFRSLRKGRLFFAEPTTAPTTGVRSAMRKRDKLECFSLCDTCCKLMTVSVDSNHHVVITSIQEPAFFKSALEAFGRR